MRLEEFEKTFVSQYANSEKWLALLYAINRSIEPNPNIRTFYDLVHNLDTCGTFGLNVWGIIVAAPREIQVDDNDYFGFYGSNLEPFNSARFYTGKNATSMFTMTDEAYRQMIYFKAMVNIMNTTIPAINAVLWAFMEKVGIDGDVYAQETPENGVMTMRIVFRTLLTPTQRAIFRTYGKLLRPGGVGINIFEIPYTTFGFKGSDLMPFNQGTYFAGSIGNLN